MGQKFTADDLFRIAERNLSSFEEFEFRFLCTTSEFRTIVGTTFEADLNLDADERDLLEKIFTKLAKMGLLRGGAR